MISAVHEKLIGIVGHVSKALYRREGDSYVVTVFEYSGSEGSQILIYAD